MHLYFEISVNLKNETESAEKQQKAVCPLEPITSSEEEILNEKSNRHTFIIRPPLWYGRYAYSATITYY